MTSPPPAPSAPTPELVEASRLPRRSDRFFSWSAGLGVVRGDGWIGGVSVGLAARMRVDPLIVRGILVVVGLFGFPVVFLYGIAWAILPDLDGRIPLQQALRGRFAPSQVGAAIFLVAGLAPAPIAFLWGGNAFGWMLYGAPGWFALVVVAVIAAIVLTAGLVFLIVRAARQNPMDEPAPIPGAADTDLRTASAASAAPDTSDTDSGWEPEPGTDARGVDALSDADTASLPAPISTPEATPDGETDDLAAWKDQHAAWKEQDQQWRQQQQDAVRAAREQARRERQARATAFAAEAAERRRVRRATSPRTPFSYVAVAIGVALVVGTSLALQHGGDLAPALGLFAGALVLALAMALAGALRRRSGFLAFLTALTLAGGIVAAAIPTAGVLHVGGYGISNTQSERFTADDPFTQPWGDLFVTLADTGRDGEMHVQKRSGWTSIRVEPGVAVNFDVTTRSGSFYVVDEEPTGESGPAVWLPEAPGVTTQYLPDGRQRYTGRLVSGVGETTTEQKLVIEQDSGYIEFWKTRTEENPE